MGGERDVHLVHELVTEIHKCAPLEGANASCLPGLTTYRFTGPVTWLREQVRSPSLVVVVQGRQEVAVSGESRELGPFELLVLGGNVQMEADVREATRTRPFLCVLLEIDPQVVRRVSNEMAELKPARSVGNVPAPPALRDGALDLLSVVVRARHGISNDLDRRVLAPLYLQEIVYRLLQRGLGAPLQALGTDESIAGRLAAVIDYVRAHLAEPLTVSDMAGQAHMSPSAFAHLFRDTTGRSPYQFLKDMRLDRACDLLIDGDPTVRRVSREVGYASVSQFIRAFRHRFGITPHSYADMYAAGVRRHNLAPASVEG